MRLTKLQKSSALDYYVFLVQSNQFHPNNIGAALKESGLEIDHKRILESCLAIVAMLCDCGTNDLSTPRLSRLLKNFLIADLPPVSEE